MNATLTKDCRGVLTGEGKDALRIAVEDAELITGSDEPNLLNFELSDYGNAERLQAMFGEDIRFVTGSGDWLIWQESRWVKDTSGAIVRMFIKAMRCTAHQALDSRNGKETVSHALKAEDRPRIEAAIHLAKSLPGVSISVGEIDSDPWFVGTPSGSIDLRTGKPARPDRRRLITKSIGTDYDLSAECPTWEKFIQTVTGGDAELVGFLQDAIGYTLTGSPREQCLFFLHGGGDNGKGCFSETLNALLGDYAQTAPESIFTKDRNSSGTNDIARLVGCRMATAAELEEGAAFAESRLKSLTGGDTITARFLHKEFFDFKPTHKFWISGNHKPSVRGNDAGIWRRLRLIPFNVTVPKAEQDRKLPEKLQAELPGILRWALEGCLRWQAEGLAVPKCVSKATEEYRASEDIIGQFLAECTEFDDNSRVLQSSLYESYRHWSEEMGIKFPLTATKLNRKLEERGLVKIKSHGGRYWLGITIN